MYALARSLLFTLDAETAHGLGLRAMNAAYRSGLGAALARPPEPLPARAFGIDFPNPVGLAAGLDKNGACIDALASLGFGFIEIGTTTPKPQPGNSKPRMWRLPEHRAIINRLGFNNHGVDALVRNVERARRSVPLGINIGRNADTPNENALDDYRTCLQRVYPLADYITVNISSPNTKGLRALQSGDALAALLGGLMETRESLSGRHGRRVPLLVKVAPDLDDAAIDDIARALDRVRVDGVIATNTTLERSSVAAHRHAREAGGLSGPPLLKRSNRVLAALRARLDASIELIGVGGIDSADSARSKRAAGAALVQFYTGLVYRGPALIHECVDALR